MDKPAVKAIVERELAGLSDRLGIRHWHLKVNYESVSRNDSASSTTRGECARLVDYDRATITLYADALDDEADVLTVLRHELFHIVLAKFDVFWHVTKDLRIPDDARTMLDSVWEHGCEQTIVALERMYQGLTAPQPQPQRDPG